MNLSLKSIATRPHRRGFLGLLRFPYCGTHPSGQGGHTPSRGWPQNGATKKIKQRNSTRLIHTFSLAEMVVWPVGTLCRVEWGVCVCVTYMKKGDFDQIDARQPLPLTRWGPRDWIFVVDLSLYDINGRGEEDAWEVFWPQAWHRNCVCVRVLGLGYSIGGPQSVESTLT